MTLEALYRRSLIVVALLALSAAGVAGYVAYAWSATGPLVVTAASVALAGGALLARRGRLWRPMLLLALGSGLCAAAALALVPWWVAVPAGLGVVAFGLLVPAMMRRDRLAAAVSTILAAAFGIQGACAVDAAAHEPRATLEGFEVATVKVPARASEAYWRGRRDAERDLAAGRWRLLAFGHPSAWRPIYRDVLLRDGIELVSVAGCVVTAEIMDHAGGYNDVAEAAIGRMLGPDYLPRQRQLAQEASQFSMQ